MTHLAVNSLTDPMEFTGYPSPPEDFRYDRVLPLLPPGPDPLDAKPYYATRHRPEPGEIWYSTKTWPIKPMTLDNDARSMPYQYNINPSLPIRDFSRQFPHTWIDYEDMYAAVYPDEPPMPSGYAPSEYAHNELKRAIDVAMPTPWLSEDKMTQDISGFGSLGEAAGLGQWGLPTISLNTAPATDAVKDEADKAKEEGASSSTVNDIVNFGAQIGALYLQKRALDQQMKEAERQRASQLEIERLRLQQQQLAVEAARAGAGSEVVNDMSPSKEKAFYEEPLVIVPAVAAAAYGASQLI